MFRKTLVANDPDRSWLYCWNVAGLPGPFTLRGPDGKPFPAATFRLPRTGEGWKDRFHNGVQLPASAAPGPWTLDAGGIVAPFTVTPRSSRPWWPAPAKVPAATVSAHLLSGYNVELPAGYYEWTGPVILPPVPCTIRGYGATIRRVDSGDANDYRQRVFWGGKGFTLEGVTVYGVPGGIVFHAGMYCGAPGQNDAADPASFTGTGFVVKHCHFRSGNFGYSLYEVLVRDCSFDGSGCTEAPRGMYLRNQFRNAGSPHSFGMTAGCAGDVALIDNVLTNTARGPVFDTTNASYVDGLFFGTRMIGIAGEVNGCESFMAEGGPAAMEFSRHLIFNTRYDGLGSLVQLDCPAFDNVIQDAFSRSPGGLILYGSFPQERNQFTDVELEGPITLGPLARNNTFTNCGQRWLGPSRGNQGGYVDYGPRPAAISADPSNRLVNHHFSVPAGTIPSSGFTVT